MRWVAIELLKGYLIARIDCLILFYFADLPEEVLPSGCTEEPQSDPYRSKAIQMRRLFKDVQTEGRLSEAYGGQAHDQVKWRRKGNGKKKGFVIDFIFDWRRNYEEI